MNPAGMETLVAVYGYAAVLLGTFLEGETVLVIAGFAAHRGYLALPWVMIWAFTGTFFGDQLYFVLGRRYGAVLLGRHPRWQRRVERVRTLLSRYHVPFILSFRFLYGLRTVSPFAIGLSSVSWSRYFLLDAAGAVLWVVTFATVGYGLGEAAQSLLGDLKHYELGIFVAIAMLGAVVWALQVRRRRREQSANG